MSVKFFGQFLIERKVIAPEQLLEALKLQEDANERIGQYAVSKGFISKEAAQSIFEKQKSTDKLFGELAVESGILTQKQLDEILILQHNDHVYVGAALVRMKFMSPDALVKELTLFRKDQAQYADDSLILPDEMSDPETVSDMITLTQRMLNRVSRIVAKVGDGYVNTDEPERNFSVMLVGMNGDLQYDYIISADLEASESIATGILGSNAANEPSDIISDCVKEFANIVAGNITAKMAQRGKKVEITTPVELSYENDTYDIVRGRSAVYYPFVSTAGDITLIMAEGERPEQRE